MTIPAAPPPVPISAQSLDAQEQIAMLRAILKEMHAIRCDLNYRRKALMNWSETGAAICVMIALAAILVGAAGSGVMLVVSLWWLVWSINQT